MGADALDQPPGAGVDAGLGLLAARCQASSAGAKV